MTCSGGVPQDYQALVEADFLVNLFEDGATPHTIETAYETIFATETGRELMRQMFGLAGSRSG